MRYLIALLCASGLLAQFPVPGGGTGGGGGGYTAPSGYTFTVTAQTSVTKTAAEHGQGTFPNVSCWNESDGEEVSFRKLNPSFLGDITLQFSPAFTGRCWLRGPGADAGAAGNVVGPASSTSGNLPSFSGTSGKTLADSGIAATTVVKGAASLTIAGAVPYVTSAGELGQAPTGLFYDSANVRLGVGTGTPLSKFVLTDGSNSLSFGSVVSTYSGIARGNVSIGTTNYFIASDGSGVLLNAPAGDIGFNIGNAGKAVIKQSTGNLLIGTTTDDTVNKLQVAGSVYATGKFKSGASAGSVFGESGSAFVVNNFANTETRFYINTNGYTDNYIKGSVGIGQEMTGANSATLFVQNGTATTGSTLLAVQAGAGQSTGLLSIRNNAGTEIMSVDSVGAIIAANIQAGASNFIFFTGRSAFSSPSDGVLRLSNNAVSDFNRLQFGGTTSSFPALKRTSAGIDVRLADDSAYTTIQASLVQSAATTVAALPAAAAGNAGSRAYVTDANATTIGTTVAGGGSNKVMVWSDGTNWKIYAN